MLSIPIPTVRCVYVGVVLDIIPEYMEVYQEACIWYDIVVLKKTQQHILVVEVTEWSFFIHKRLSVDTQT